MPAQDIAAPKAQAADPAIAPVVKTAPRRVQPKASAAPVNLGLVFVDPAHGGADPGAKLGENSLEKDVTLTAADKLAAALTARGFTVVRTRTTASDDPAMDARIDLANRSHALACVSLHATAAGKGVHVYSSSLRGTTVSTLPKAVPDDPAAIQPIAAFDTAQVPFVAQSQRLAGDVASALNAQHLPLVLGRSSPRPLDALACPAIAVELAPYAQGDDPAALSVPSDAAYQQHVAEALATTLQFMRARLQNAAPAPSRATSSPRPVGTSARPVPSVAKPLAARPVPARPAAVPAREPQP